MAEVDTGGESHSELRLLRRKRRLLDSRAVTSVRALACTGCGLVTFHVTDLDKLRAEAATYPDTFRWEE